MEEIGEVDEDGGEWRIISGLAPMGSYITHRRISTLAGNLLQAKKKFPFFFFINC